MRIVLLGGTIFIGRAILNALDRSGHEILLIHRGVHEPPDLPTVEHLHVDRRDIKSVAETVTRFAPEVLIDTCAGTRKSAEATVEALGDGHRCVVLSSMDVYLAYTGVLSGRHVAETPLTEDSPVREERYPLSGRGINADDYEKLDVEEVYLERGATILRLPMVYGEHDSQRREEFVLRRVRAGRKKIPVGPGDWLWSRGYVRDIAAAVRLAAESVHLEGEILNLCHADTWTVRKWMERILVAAESAAKLVPVTEDSLPADLRITASAHQHFLAESTKAREVLDWKETDPEEAVGNSVRWHLVHPPESPSLDFSDDDRALAAVGK